ncbi:MAG: hypothetical protein R2854_10225 [Caldilineaceae bacterium]
MTSRILRSDRIWLACARRTAGAGLLAALGTSSRAVSLHVDEFTTLWAATLVQEHGVPYARRRALHARAAQHVCGSVGHGALRRKLRRWPA